MFPGSLYSPQHTGARRLAYAGMAVLTGLTASFGNALVTVNAPSLAGPLGLYSAQLAWLPAIYIAFNATANLSLVKARTQFGVPRVTAVLLVAYALAAGLQLAWPTFAVAALTRAAAGMAAAALATMTVYGFLQAFPAKVRPLALIFGISLSQLGPVLARMTPVELVVADHGRGLHLMELGVALAALAVTTVVRLPPSDRSRVFERLDFLTIGLTIPGMLLLCGVLSLGRVLWWTDTPWLGWALAGAIPLLMAVAVIEHYRARPLLQTRWIGTVDMMRFAAVAVLVRVALAEQTYGSVGLLTSGGLNNDQLRTLFAVVGGAMALGMVVAALTLSERRIPYQVLAAAAIIGIAAWLDSHANNLTRPGQLYLSQAMIGFGTTLFLGPAMLYGFQRMVARGGDHLVTFVVVFSMTQNLGGLAGSALLGTYQTIAARAHAAALSEHVNAFDPQVAARIQAGASSLSGVVVDPLARGVQGGGLLGQAIAREANILAFNDTFRLVALLALLTVVYVAYIIVFNTIRRRRAAAAEPAA
ncbi:MAG: MFS transporter [Phenylobacterium sp.]|uniref:MFS transporter n=1 Tax=Phenylobacterium sp. TaxID=1871053 RepID=UPI001A592E9A|nr:MFS transporter [Phenylobacterium sp.]MBL8553088.1 MFS transporter [Phenylobacterium sp.]